MLLRCSQQVLVDPAASVLWTVASESFRSLMPSSSIFTPTRKTLLSHWDSGQSVKDNLRRFQKDNLFGKALRSRVEDTVIRDRKDRVNFLK
jgi:hypothetical protein